MILTILMTIAWTVAALLAAIACLIIWSRLKYRLINLFMAIRCKYMAARSKNPDVKEVLNECAKVFWIMAISNRNDDKIE